MKTEHVIHCAWQKYTDDENIQIAVLVTRENSAEGLDYIRYSTTENSGTIKFASKDGHIISLVEGSAVLTSAKEEGPFNLNAPTHVFIPNDYDAQIVLKEQSKVVHVSGPAEQTTGTKLLIRNEKFAKAVRYILTPQYLSRRIFVHRDDTLMSRHFEPISIFRTTMFDTNGLPVNYENKPVLKMGYDYQSEPNICYKGQGDVSVRFAFHPYVSADKQQWTDWTPIPYENAMYYLNETANGDDVEFTNDKKPLRNRHEVSVSKGGFVTLICLFDPAPTGLEKHTPGEYSSYTPVSTIVGTPEYEKFLREVVTEDLMMDKLSMLEAQSKSCEDSEYWKVYEDFLAKKIKADQELYEKLKSDGKGRENVIENFMVKSK